MEINKIYCGHTLDVLKTFPDESIDMSICSPPYYGLRDYGLEPIIWNVDNQNCQHEWGSQLNAAGYRTSDSNSDSFQKESLGSINRDKRQKSNFCSKCGAWKGSLGLEPSPRLYISHLCSIFDEVKRVLKKEGSCWVNIGDTYGGSGGAGGDYNKGGLREGQPKYKGNKATAKSLVGIPERFVLEMQDRGWIRRNTIILEKPNCIPSSAKNRFTVDFEYLYFFVKSNKPQFWTNKKTMQLVTKKPLGIKGIEGEDWEWVNNESLNNRNFMPLDKKQKKVSLWTAHDYFFERQYEPVKQSSVDRLYRAVSNKHKWLSGADGQSKHTMSQPRPNRNYKRYEKSQAPHEFEGCDHLVSPFDTAKGRNMRCVWKIATRPFKGSHFAVFPPDLIEAPIRASCPEFVCTKCGKARVKIYKKDNLISTVEGSVAENQVEQGYSKQKGGTGIGGHSLSKREMEEIGYTKCNCHTEYKLGIVLDPFMGSGTTAEVALKQRKSYIGIEANPDYIKLAIQRLKNIQQDLL